MLIKCELCKTNQDNKEDMKNNISDKLLCDDCYTEIRYLIADKLEIKNLSELKIWTFKNSIWLYIGKIAY